MNKWVKSALIRAIKTMAQTAVALIGTSAVGILDVHWISVLSASALAGVLSVLTSVAGLPEVDKHTLENASEIVMQGDNALKAMEKDDGVTFVEEEETPEGIGATFVPYLSAPTESDKNWIHYTKGGYNYCILIKGNSCLPNCVGYVWGEWRKRLGKKPSLSTGNANTFYAHKDSYKRTQYPRLGSIIVWDDGGYGHVATVQKYDEKTGEITVAQSAYGGKRFYLTKHKPPYNFGAYKVLGFIHLPDSEPLPAYKATTKVAASKTTKYKVVEKSGMVIRDKASTKGKKLGTIAYNKTFTSSKTSGDWAYYDAKKGWVCIKTGKETYLKKI